MPEIVDQEHASSHTLRKVDEVEARRVLDQVAALHIDCSALPIVPKEDESDGEGGPLTPLGYALNRKLRGLNVTEADRKALLGNDESSDSETEVEVESKSDHVRARESAQLVEAAKNGDVAQVTVLLRDVENSYLLRSASEPEDENAWGTVAWSSINDHRLVTKKLIAAGADVDHADDKGWTAIMWASRENHAEIVKVLIAAGADPNKCNEYGSTALMWASEMRNETCVRILLDAKANVNIAGADGSTALVWGSGAGNRGVVQRLMQAKASVNTANKEGYTPLAAACRRGHPHIVRLLLENNADFLLRTVFNLSPLDIAKNWPHNPSHRECATMLQSLQNKYDEEQRAKAAKLNSGKRRLKGAKKKESKAAPSSSPRHMR